MTEVKEGEFNHEEDKINIDKILAEEVGEGKYHVQTIALFGAVCFFFGLTTNNFIFIAERVKTRCKIQECEENDQTSFSPPWLANAVPEFGDTLDNCHRFAPSDSWNISGDSCPADMFNRSTILQCTDYVYQHHNSAVYEFGLACDEWRWFLFGAIPLLGMTISTPVTGIVSDRWGRRFALTITAFNLSWIHITKYWATSYNIYMFISFLGSVFGSACTSCCYILAMELVAPSRRTLAVSILTTCASLGSVVKGLIAWTHPYWRDLILMTYLPMLTSVSYFWIGPESVRWLMSKNRFEDAKTVLLQAAKTNGRTLSDMTLKRMAEGAMSSKSMKPVGGSGVNFFCLVWEHKTIFLRCIIFSIWSLSSAFMVKGLTISSVSISGNKYVNYCTVTAVAIPGFWLSTLLNNKIGRKRFLFALFWMGGSCQLGYIFMSKGPQWIQLALYLLSKLCTSAVQATIAVYKTELLPTTHRSRLSAFTATFARFGSVIGLLTPALADRVWVHLPNTIFSILAFVSGVLTLFTPETLGGSLPATMEDAARIGKDDLNVRELLKRLFCRKKSSDDVGEVDLGKLA